MTFSLRVDTEPDWLHSPTDRASATRGIRPGEPNSIEEADLVVVGAGLSGLAAAYFAQRRFGFGLRIVLMEQSARVGGMAKRVELSVGTQRLTTNGGARAFSGTRSWTSPLCHGLLNELGLLASDPNPAALDGLHKMVHMGRAGSSPGRVVAADALFQCWTPDQDPAVRRAIDELPAPRRVRDDLTRIWCPDKAPAPVSSDQLRAISYRSFLADHLGAGPEATDFLRRRTIGTFGSPAERVPAFDALAAGMPGEAHASSLGVQRYSWIDEPALEYSDGLAAVAESLLSRLHDRAASGGGQVDVTLRHRVFSITPGADGVAVTAHGPTGPSHFQAPRVVFAGSARSMARVVEGLPVDVHDALERVVKPPMCYVNVAVRSWESMVSLGAREVWSPDEFFYDVALRVPAGGPRGGAGILELVHRPLGDDAGIDFRHEARQASQALLDTRAESFRSAVVDQLDALLGPYGFDAERDIADVVVNAWPHTYSPPWNSLVDDRDAFVAEMKKTRRPIEGLAVAGVDSHRFGWAQVAIDAGERAVNDLPEPGRQATW
ncbi:NAD(P)-binding protein [Kribbella sp. DT2]|uniref:NAD(P)-binding protein n=1 Tax=Kribbella sp. DT2 TaxID=3393427 RepID=UPI003CE92356